MVKIAILGTGAWGTALANVLMQNKHQVYMWGINKDELNDLQNKKNKFFFGEKKLVASPKIATNNFAQISLQNPKYIIIAVPSSFILQTLTMSLQNLKSKPIIINVAKGLDPLTNKIWSDTIKKNTINKIRGLVTLSGPSFAKEAFDNQPTIVNAISSSKKIAIEVACLFKTDYFRCIPLQDEIGGQIFGAFKNVIAIGMGMIYSLYEASNTRAAMLSQGTKEIFNIMQVLGGKEKTIIEFCSLGDVYLTCTDKKSRNFLFGEMVMQNGVNYALQHFNKTIEGHIATEIAYGIITKHKIHSPFIEEIFKILYKNANPKSILKNIFNRL